VRHIQSSFALAALRPQRSRECLWIECRIEQDKMIWLQKTFD